MDGIIGIFIRNLFQFDWLIWVMAVVNGWAYYRARVETNTIYEHFNLVDPTVNLNDEAKEALKSCTKGGEKKLKASELLRHREEMNKWYAVYSNITTMFPLMGMLGTVCSLIPMVNAIGTETTGLFFSALTSTFWGIVAALIFKGLDFTISYKIEDNEKHMEYIFNPGRKSSQESKQ